MARAAGRVRGQPPPDPLKKAITFTYLLTVVDRLTIVQWVTSLYCDWSARAVRSNQLNGPWSVRCGLRCGQVPFEERRTKSCGCGQCAETTQRYAQRHAQRRLPYLTRFLSSPALPVDWVPYIHEDGELKCAGRTSVLAVPISKSGEAVATGASASSRTAEWGWQAGSMLRQAGSTSSA